MRKLNILLLLLISSISCTQKIKEPQNIGKAVFDILQKDITSMSMEEYAGYLLSKDEVKSYGINSEKYVNDISDIVDGSAYILFYEKE